jgi:hypothetical protein
MQVLQDYRKSQSFRVYQWFTFSLESIYWNLATLPNLTPISSAFVGLDRLNWLDLGKDWPSRAKVGEL